MNSITINGYNLQEEYDLYLPEYDIPAPEPFLSMIAVEGHDGLVDLSNAFGRVYYKNREWDLKLKHFDPTVNWHTISAQVNSRFHGKSLTLRFDDDPEYYWVGRIKNGAYSSSKGEGTFPITISTQPYKYKLNPTTVTKTVSGTTSITLPNADMWVCPNITVSSQMSITFQGITDPAASGIVGQGIVGQMVVGADGTTVTATISGNAKIPQFLIPQGGTVVSVTGSGTIKFTYQEGVL